MKSHLLVTGGQTDGVRLEDLVAALRLTEPDLEQLKRIARR